MRASKQNLHLFPKWVNPDFQMMGGTIRSHTLDGEENIPDFAEILKEIFLAGWGFSKLEQVLMTHHSGLRRVVKGKHKWHPKKEVEVRLVDLYFEVTGKRVTL